MAPPAAPGTTHLRDSWRGRILNIALLAAFMAVLVARSDGTARIVWVAFCVLLAVGEIYRSVRPVATLSAERIVVHNLRPREVAWARIQDVTTHKRGAERILLGGERIVLVTDDGGRIVLDAPAASILARAAFKESLQTVHEWWVRHRGPNWVKGSPAAAQPAQPAQAQYQAQPEAGEVPKAQ